VKVLPFRRPTESTQEPIERDSRSLGPEPIATMKQPHVVGIDWLRWQGYGRWRRKLLAERERERSARKDELPI
jgi:hypothetical protein